jgi:hypothetical protein
MSSEGLTVDAVKRALTGVPLPNGTVLGGRSYADWREWYTAVTHRLNQFVAQPVSDSQLHSDTASVDNPQPAAGEPGE